MLSLVSGGAASGKSEYAESLILASEARPRVYVATMEAWDRESRERVRRHRDMRKDKGFVTVEAPRNLAHAELPQGSAALLECMSNLCANECFSPDGFAGAYDRIWQGICHLLDACEDVVIVTNELFSDGISYAPETEQYLSILADLNRAIAARADRVYEVCCGIPILWKGANP